MLTEKSRNAWRLLLPTLIIFLVLPACSGGQEVISETGETAVATAEPAAEEVVAETPAPPVSFEGEVVIYVVGPLSGLDAEKGQAQAAGARLAAEELNRAGGLLGQKIVIKVLNDAGEPAGALEAAEKVVTGAASGENVVGIVLTEGSDPQLEAVQQVYLGPDAATPPLVVVPVSTNPAPVDIEDDRLFRLSAPNASQASEMANLFHELNLQDLVVVHSNTDHDRALVDAFHSACNALGLNVLADIEISPDAVSYSEAVAEVQQLKPGVLLMATGDLEAAAFLSELFGFEFHGQVYGLDRALSFAVVDELGCQAEGMHFVSMVPDPAAVMSGEQLTNYATLTGREAEPYTVAGYAGVEFIVDAFQDAGSLDVTQAAAAGRQQSQDTLLGEITYDATGQLADTRVHFFQASGNMFHEAFARSVGAASPVSQAATVDTDPLLDIPFPVDKEPVVFAGLNWASVEFANYVARFIVESGYGYPTYAVPGSSLPLFYALRKGEVQVMMEVWLPNNQESYDDAIAKNEIVDVGLNFGNAVQGWFVPRYVIEGDPQRGIEALAPDLKTVEDLERYAHLFATPDQPGVGRVLNGSPGWFAYKIDCMKLKAYRLDDKYGQMTAGSEGALFSALQQAYENGEPILTYMYEPSWPMAEFDLVQIGEPDYSPDCWSSDKGCAFPPTDVRTVVHSDLPQRTPEVVSFLENYSMESSEISQVLLIMKQQDLGPEEAAMIWLKENEATWSTWVPGDVAQRVADALGR